MAETVKTVMTVMICIGLVLAGALDMAAARPGARAQSGADAAARAGLGVRSRPIEGSASSEAPDERSARLAKAFRSAVDVLAADAMEGRGLGTAGIRKAADWIEGRLGEAGLAPAFGASYRQTFAVKTGVTRRAGNRLEGVADSDWTPLGCSSSGAFAGELAFVGYGMDAPPIGYREYAGVDLKGKVALMLRYEPQEKDDGSPFDGRQPSRWSALRYKVLQARERGASAVVFVTGPAQDEGEDRIPVLKNDGPESPAGIPVLQVKASVARRWLAPAGVDLAAFQEQVDRDLIPRSRGVTGVRIRGAVALDPETTTADNLAGMLPGRGSLASEVVVVGAHYDHLGMGGERSMRPNVRAVHNGADDNASGVAAAILIGEELSLRLAGASDRRTVVIALFAAEEVGLGGSSAFVAQPPLPKASIAAMINLDMVGRLREDRLVVYGTESAAEWTDGVARAAASVPGGLAVTTRGDGYGPSDQTSFYAAGIPVLYLFTGQHERYHTPDDDPETLNAEGAAKVVRFAAALAGDTALAPARPTYQRAGPEPSREGDSRGYGAYLGTVPDYRAMEGDEGGVLLADVRAGGPADLAGIRGGDRIVEMAGTRIENLHDMTYALQDHKPGETIVIELIRAGVRLRVKATLGDRQNMGGQGGGQGAGPSAHGSAARGPSAHGPSAQGTGSSGGTGPALHAPGGHGEKDRSGGAGGPEAMSAAGPAGTDLPAVSGATSAPTVTRGDQSAATSARTEAEAAAQEQKAQSAPTVPTATRAPTESAKTEPAATTAPDAPTARTAKSAAEAAAPTVPGAPAAPGAAIAAFYENRPGPLFVVAAGKPYEKALQGETRLKEVRQLTFGGENAEAYFSPDGRSLIYQWTPPGGGCDQQYVMDLATGRTTRVSSGKGRTTCGYFRWPQGNRIVYSSTEAGGDSCPPPPDRSKGYVWALYETFDLWEAERDGARPRRLTTTPGYDAEATWCHRGGKFVFTSVRHGDLDLYTMNEAGDVKRLTREAGYDGGAFFSPDCSEIVWRASRPQGKDLDEYRALLAEGLVRPRNTEIYVARSDGSRPKQLTANGAANFCPYFTADGGKIIYASNAEGGRQEFELYLIPKEGGEPVRITFAPGFDGFPVFSPDGRWLVWASNRAAPETHETNLFIARWSE